MAAPNLFMVETVDSLKLADLLNKECLRIERKIPLNVLVQVLTGDEDSKFGVLPADVAGFVEHINNSCPALAFRGLMAMGKVGDLEGFKQMSALRSELLPSLLERKVLQSESEFEISMGTSADWEAAVEEGSTQVRLGTTIFGARDYSKKN